LSYGNAFESRKWHSRAGAIATHIFVFASEFRIHEVPEQRAELIGGVEVNLIAVFLRDCEPQIGPPCVTGTS
jgi:hypothetical protein